MDKFEKAISLRQRGGILRDECGDYYIPSGSTEGLTYCVSRDGFCSCPAWGACAHLLASVWLDALLAVTLLRWADSLDMMDEVAAQYGPRVNRLPERIRAVVRHEYKEARARLSQSAAA